MDILVKYLLNMYFVFILFLVVFIIHGIVTKWEGKSHPFFITALIGLVLITYLERGIFIDLATRETQTIIGTVQSGAKGIHGYTYVNTVKNEYTKVQVRMPRSLKKAGSVYDLKVGYTYEIEFT